MLVVHSECCWHFVIVNTSGNMSDNSKSDKTSAPEAQGSLTGTVRQRSDDETIEDAGGDHCLKRTRADVTAEAAAGPTEIAESLSTRFQVNCAICLEGENEGKELFDHNCPRCTKGSWRVCEPCNDTLLSRRCPICHGDYKAIEFFAFLNPESGDSALVGLAVAAFSRCKVSVMATSNVMIWSPAANTLSFSLPVDASVPKRDIQYLRSSIVPSAEDVSCLRAGVFSFTNKVWDSLEAAEESTEQTGVREMLAWVLHSLSDPQAVLFTALTKEQQLELLRETLRTSLGEVTGSA